MAFNFKIVLVGDGGVGKSSFVKKHRKGEFEKKYLATQGVDVSPLQFNTNYGIVTFKVWDCAGQEKFGGLRDGYYLDADGAIVMFDMSNKITCDNVPKWIEDIHKTDEYIPIIVCANKRDLSDKKTSIHSLARYLKDITYYEISVNNNYNFEKPFLALARQLTNHEDLEFVDMPTNTFSFDFPVVTNTLPTVSSSLPVVNNTLPTVSSSLPVVNNTLPVVTLKTSDILPKKKICMMTIPGGYMKVTYEFFKDGEVIEQEGF
jgi:GTP-binding nuclear protein Ran